MLKAKASDHASRGDQFSPSEQRPQAGISFIRRALATVAARAAKRMRYASGVALLAATQLPAKASPTFDLKSSTSMLQLWVGEAAVVAEAGLTLAAVEWVAAEWATWVIWAAVATTTCGRMARGDMAAQIGTVETLPTTETLPAITGMGIGIVTTISITGSL